MIQLWQSNHSPLAAIELSYCPSRYHNVACSKLLDGWGLREVNKARKSGGGTGELRAARELVFIFSRCSQLSERLEQARDNVTHI